MGWMDIVTIAIVVIMSLIGYKKGFTVTVMHIASWIIAGITAIKFYPVLSSYFIEKTEVYNKIWDFISGRLKTMAAVPVEGSTFNISDFIKLPKVVNDMVEGLDFSSKEIISSTVGEAVSKILLDVLSIVIIFIVVKLALFIITIILDRITNLPVLKQMNRAGGLLVGFLKGILLIFIILAILVPVIGITENQVIIQALEKSQVTKYLYDHNIVFQIIESYFK